MILKDISWLVIWLLPFLITITKASMDISDTYVANRLFQDQETTPRTIHIGGKLLEMELKINAMNISLEVHNDSSFYQKAAFIGMDLINLQKEIYNQKIAERFSKYKASVETLRTFCNSLNCRLVQIKKKLTDMEKDCNSNNAIEAVQKFEFLKAENVLEFADNPEKTIEILVNEVYKNNKDNINILQDFAASLSTIDRTIMVLKYLFRKIIVHKNTFQMINFMWFVSKNLINQINGREFEYTDVMIFYHDVEEYFPLMKNHFVDVMEIEMINHTFRDNERVQDIVRQLYNINASFSNEVLFETIDRVYGNVSNSEILENIFKQCGIQQKQDILIHFYGKLKDQGEVKKVTLKLAEYTNDLLWDYDSDLKGEKYATLMSIWNSFSSSVQALFSGKLIYLKNKWMPEYVYAASDGFTNGAERRYVFSWIPGANISQGLWNIDHDFESEDFYFINVAHKNEYIYASEDGIGKRQKFQYVFTWKPQGRVDSGKSAWNIVPIGDYVTIVNVFNKQLLCLTVNKYSPDRRYVLTIKADFLFAGLNPCLWTLETFD